MAGIHITVDEALLPGLLSGDGTGVAHLMQSVLNQVLSVQAEEAAGAGRYERSEGVGLPIAQATACARSTPAWGR